MALKFKILDVPVAIGFDFFLVMLLLGSWRPAEELPVWLVVVTVSVLLHELGHAAVAESYEAHPSIRLYAGGGVTTMPMLGARAHLLVAAAGPAVGLVIGGVAAAVANAAPNAVPEPWIGDIIWVNLGWGLLNLLPIPGLDGGAILTSAVTLVLKRPSELAGAVVGLVLAFGVIGVLVVAGQPDWAFVVGFMLVIVTFLNRSLPGMSRRGGAVDVGKLLREGRYQEAYDAVEGYLAGHPDDLRAVSLAADALRLQSDYTNSLRGYEFVLSREPGDPHARRGRILDLVALGRREEALRELAPLLPTTGMAAISLATSLYALDLHADGYRFTHAPMAGDAGMIRAMANLAVVFEYTTGRLDEALAHVDGLLAASPGEPDLHELRALILSDLGYYGEAETAIGHALRAAPRQPEFRQSLGLVLRMGGNAEAALGPLMDSATARPYGARARGELIACHVQLGKLMEARAALETLPGYARQDPFVIYGQAALAAASGATDEASNLLARAAAMRPELGLRARRDPVMASLAAATTTA